MPQFPLFAKGRAMAGGDLGVPRGVSGIGVIGKRDNCHPKLNLLAGVDTEGSRHPLRVRSRLGGIMAPAKHWGRGSESLLGPKRVGSTQKKREQKLKSRHTSVKPACCGRTGLTAEGGTGSWLAPHCRAWPGTWVLCPDPTCYCSFPLRQLLLRYREIFRGVDGAQACGSEPWISVSFRF